MNFRDFQESPNPFKIPIPTPASDWGAPVAWLSGPVSFISNSEKSKEYVHETYNIQRFANHRKTQATGPLTQAAGSPQSDAGVGIGILRRTRG